MSLVNDCNQEASTSKLQNMQKNQIFALAVCLSMMAGCASSPKQNTSSQNKTVVPHDAATDLALWNANPKPVITFTEFIDHVCDLYASLDHDHDGYLEVTETGKIPAWLGKVQAGSNGRISIVDFVNAGTKQFKKFAKKNKNTLTQAEWSALEKSQS